MTKIKQVLIPDIGDFKDVPVIEVLVKLGDQVKAEDPLITLESDKATIEVPAPFAGVIKEINIKVGDKVSAGTPVLLLQTSELDAAAISSTAMPVVAVATALAPTPAPTPIPTSQLSREPLPALALPDEVAFAKAHASPSVRRFVRELGVNLGLIKGSGPKQRILKEDVQTYVKSELSRPRGGGSNGAELNLLPWPQVNFAKFGPVKSQPLSRIQKMSGANLHRNWVMIPHVTQFDEADITDLETLRAELNKTAKKNATKITILSFLMKASITALRKFPEFNASLDSNDGEMNLVIKGYYHLGFAADTPNGLMVPVIRNVDQKDVVAIAEELGNLSALARESKLKPAEMQGASFTISSLGGIGGTAFTPIINAPEVAILGVSRASMKPVHRAGQFIPRLMLPLSLSYDHRVIDGASAARFTSYLSAVLADMHHMPL